MIKLVTVYIPNLEGRAISFETLYKSSLEYKFPYEMGKKEQGDQEEKISQICSLFKGIKPLACEGSAKINVFKGVQVFTGKLSVYASSEKDKVEEIMQDVQKELLAFGKIFPATTLTFSAKQALTVTDISYIQ